MPCLCKLSLKDLAAALAGLLKFPSLNLNMNLNADLKGLMLALPRLDLAAALSAGLPAMSMSALDMRLALAGSALLSMSGMGLSLSLPNLPALLASLIGSINLHLPSLLPINFALGPLLDLSALASLLSFLKGLGIPALTANLAASLKLALGPLLAAAGVNASLLASMGFGLGALPAMNLALSLKLPGLSLTPGLALMLQAAAAHGININLGNPLAAIAALLKALLAMLIPHLTLPPLPTLDLLKALGAIANIKAALGINLLAPGALLALPKLMASLNLHFLMNLKLPLPPLPSLNLSAALPGLPGLGPLALALNLPGLQGLTLAGSLAGLLGPLGAPLLKTPCSVCPFR
jgi:hypothetical protein